jgi:MFS-type transporter involved in bile tolerance (Atg22 family)
VEHCQVFVAVFALILRNDQDGQIFGLYRSIGALLRPFFQQVLPARHTNKDPTVWLDGARPPPKYISQNNMSLTNSKIKSTSTLHYLTAIAGISIMLLSCFLAKVKFEIALYGEIWLFRQTC